MALNAYERKWWLWTPVRESGGFEHLKGENGGSEHLNKRSGSECLSWRSGYEYLRGEVALNT